MLDGQCCWLLGKQKLALLLLLSMLDELSELAFMMYAFTWGLIGMLC